MSKTTDMLIDIYNKQQECDHDNTVDFGDEDHHHFVCPDCGLGAEPTYPIDEDVKEAIDNNKPF